MTGQKCSRVANLHSEFHGGHTGLQVADHGGPDNHRDHAHIQAPVEGHYELNACRVEQGHVVTRVEVKFVCDVGSNTLSSLVKRDGVDGSEGMTLHNIGQHFHELSYVEWDITAKHGHQHPGSPELQHFAKTLQNAVLCS